MFSSKTTRSLYVVIFNDMCVYLTKLDLQFRAFGSQVRKLPSKNDLPELIPGDPRIPRVPRKCDWDRSSQPPFTRAGGQDDVSLEQTPSNNMAVSN